MSVRDSLAIVAELGYTVFKRDAVGIPSPLEVLTSVSLIKTVGFGVRCRGPGRVIVADELLPTLKAAALHILHGESVRAGVRCVVLGRQPDFISVHNALVSNGSLAGV